MKKSTNRLLKKLIAISLAAMLTVGGVPTFTGGFVDLGTSISVNAVQTTVNVTSYNEFMDALDDFDASDPSDELTIVLDNNISTDQEIAINKNCSIERIAQPSYQRYGRCCRRSYGDTSGVLRNGGENDKRRDNDNNTPAVGHIGNPAGGAAMVVLTCGFRRLLKRKSVQEKDGAVRIFMQEAIGNMMMIRLFSSERQTELEMTVSAERLMEIEGFEDDNTERPLALVAIKDFYLI